MMPLGIMRLNFWALVNGFGKKSERRQKRISENPEAWSVEHGEVRKCILHKFPYKLLYSIEKDFIFIIAIAHQHRKPDYWI